MHRAGNPGHVLVIEHAVDTGLHAPELAGIDEQHLAPAVAAMGGLALGQEPQAGGNLGVEEELRRQRHHDFHHVGLDHGLADGAFVVLVGRHAAVGQHHAGLPVGVQVPEDVLQPGVVRIARVGRAVEPALVVQQAVAAPVGDVERRIGQHVVGLEVGVLVAVEGVGGFLAEVEVHAPDGQVHRH